MKVIKDQISRTVEIPENTERIVSLVPSQTELLYDLGLEDRIVGITKFCVHPFHFKSTKTIVGGTKQVKADRIKELKPDIILCNKEENSKEIVEELEKIAPVHVSDIFSIDDATDLIKVYGDIFDCRVAANKIIDKIRFNLEDFKKFMESRPSHKVAYFIWRKPWMAAARNTFIQHLLELNKFENVYGDRDRYPEVDISKIREEGDPELILLSSEPFPFKDEHAFEVGRYTHHGKTVFADGEFFSWYGSRLVKAFDYFKQLHLQL
ncbi:ABC transporter substrate-binding protein [Leptobacterium flavescens]|uniref:ABC transporter substrate-binding protein n=1 Tax=Leptobacterium flavescens TaxID=472055 RepID=A0A6P0UQ12_9FLAO|nr:helical backbone metal receptor [Leptobacterium flavescens]NER15421.1 ABC transporter substrate-binding protein [Leptobacterium flavescens]